MDDLEHKTLIKQYRVHKAHNYLCDRFSWYHAWHHHPHHKKVHFGVVSLSLILIIWFVGIVAMQSLHNRTKAASLTYDINNKEHWEAGTNTNIDIEDTFGDIKIGAAGTWGARSWKTPPNSLTLGLSVVSDGTDIYALRGNGDRAFWKYSPSANSWTVLADAPMGAYNGSYLELGPSDTIYVVFGNYTRDFYQYTISTNTWARLEDLPDTSGPGTGMSYVNGNLYVLRGINTQDFWKYDPLATEEKWSTISGPPAAVNNSSDLVYDGTYLYTLRGNGTTTWYRYNVADPAWQTMTTVYPATINEATFIEYYNGAIYVQHGVATTNLYKCTLSDLTCSGGWTTLDATPAVTRYAGVLYHSGDGFIYSFRGNSTYDFWKYDLSTGHFVGPADFPQAITTGADLVWDGDPNGYVYGLKGGNPASPANSGFYRFDIDNNTWGSALNNTNLPSFSRDTTAVKAGDYIYVFTGNSTAFWRYNTTTNGAWESLEAAPGTIGNGGSLVYPGSGDYIYATQGGTTAFYAYSITAESNRWSTFDPTDLPTGMTMNTGGRLISDGTNIYAIIGAGNSNFYKYTYAAEGGSWTKMPRAPFAPSNGTDLAYYDGKIYAIAGWYKNKFYEYNVSGESWRKLPDIQTQYLYDIGPYTGASLVFIGSNTLMMTRGNSYTSVLTYTIDSHKYLASGEYISPAIDLTYASAWNSLTTSEDTPGDSSISVQVRTSANASDWSGWQTLSGSTPANRYIQVKASLSSSTDQMETSVLSSYSINYDPDETAPSNPSADGVEAFSQEVGGAEIVSGQSYSYRHPYFTWPAAEGENGASDSGSGVVGYYVYFGPNLSANPVEDGFYQTTTNCVVNTALSSGNNYLILKTKDRSGMVSDATSPPLFTYVYSGVLPADSITKTTTADFEAGELSTVTAKNLSNEDANQLKLTGKDGFWLQNRLSTAPANLGYGGSIVYKPSVNKLYVARGAGQTAFWEYDIAGDTWNTLSSTGLTAINYGGGVVNGPGNYIYAAAGGISNKFYRYDITNNAAGWDDAAAEDAPTGSFNYGGYQIYDGARYIYAFKGSEDAFMRFDPQTTSDGQWDSRANANFGSPDQTGNNNSYNGAALAYDGTNTIYAIQGNLYSGGFAKYTITGNNWTPLTSHLPIAPTAGADLTWDSTTGYLYYIPGGSLPNMFKYNPTTGEWTEVTSGPYGFTTGAVIRAYNGTIYSFRGSSTGFYKYSIAKDSWSTPTFNLFGPNWFGTGVFTTYYGAQIIKGDNSNYYAMRGYYDDIFIKYNAVSGSATKLARIPNGVYSGSSMVYDNSANVIYLITGGVETAMFQYDIATDIWTELTSDVPPIAPGYGSSMAYDGSRYIYYARGANTTSWYRFDKTAVAGSRWNTNALPITNLGGQGYGSQMVYNDGYVYTLRGQNVNPCPFYRFKVSDLPASNPWTGSWEVLTSVNAAFYNDGFLVDGHDGYLYANPAGNHATYGNDWWRYNLSDPAWEQVADYPAITYVGASGASNGTDRIYSLSGPGTGAWADGLYTYINKTENSSFEENGSYLSESIDLTQTAGKSVYDWSNISVTYSEASNAYLTVYTQTSADNLTWSQWAEANQEKTKGNVHQYSINSTTARYLKVKFTFSSGDGILSPTIDDYSISFYNDLVSPTNPTLLTSAKSTVTNGVDIADDHWNKYTQPSFTWPEADTENGAVDNAGGSGVAGYYLYFGEAADGGVCQGDPRTTAGSLPPNEGLLYYQTETTFTVPINTLLDAQSGKIFCLRVTTKDNAGNIQAEPWQAFKYKFDNQVPSVENTIVSVVPDGWSSVDSFTFTIEPGATDPLPSSTLWKYQYRTDGDTAGEWFDLDLSWDTSDPDNPVLEDSVLTIPNDDHPTGKYTTGINYLRLRIKDSADNNSATITKEYKYNSDKPLPPSNLTVDGDEGHKTVNDFTFSWGVPEGTPVGETVTYRYAVNKLPLNESNTTTTTLSGVSGALADQPLENTFYVVAEVRGLIDYNNYASIKFYADVPDPNPPRSASVSDISNKNEETDPTGNSGEYRMVISWNQPDGFDASNFSKYQIYGTTTPDNYNSYAKVGETQGTAFVHLELEKDTTWYYYVTTVAKTTNESLASDNPETTVIDQMPHETATGKFKFAPVINENIACGKIGINCDPWGKVAYTSGAKMATFKWSTSRNAQPKVIYGTSPDNLEHNETGGTYNSSSHEIILSNPQKIFPETTYYYRVGFTDQDGNEGLYPSLSQDPLTFSTTMAPKVSTLMVENITLNSMMISWRSTTPSHGSVVYWKASEGEKASKTIEESAGNYSTDHSAYLKELTHSTSYLFYISAVDEEGNIFESDDYPGQTLPLPKVNDDLKVENKTGIDSPTVTVEYTTNVNITTVIKYAPTGGKQNNFVNLNKTTKHSAEISGLSPRTPYILEVTGTDNYGNEAIAKTFQITTESDTMPPKILNMSEKKRVIGDGANAEAQITVKLTSNEPTTMTVEAVEGVNNEGFNIISNEDPLNAEHTVPLKLKEAGKTYSYRVSLKDEAGNLTLSEVKTVVIAKANKTAFEYTLSIFSRSFGWLSKIFKP